MANDVYPKLKIRVVLRDGDMVGPGKANLLERIAETGSIAAAGRDLGMSYKRAWMLVETMNSMFVHPVVESSRGGAKGGGAVVTEVGLKVLSEYRALQEATNKATAVHVQQLSALLAPPED